METNNLTIAHKSLGDIKHQEEKTLYEVLKKLPIPKKEFNLSKDQRKWWYWFGREFVSTKQIAQVDLIHLHTAAIWLDARNKCMAKINALNLEDPDGVKGWVQRFSNNTNNITGYVTMIEKSTKHLNEVSAHFGLSIRDRQKLNVEEIDNTQLSLFESVMNKLAN